MGKIMKVDDKKACDEIKEILDQAMPLLIDIQKKMQDLSEHDYEIIEEMVTESIMEFIDFEYADDLSGE